MTMTILTVMEKVFCNFEPGGNGIPMKVICLVKHYFCLKTLFLFQSASLRGELSSVLQTEPYAGASHHHPLEHP